MQNITFLGSTNSLYGRGKDKTKRKRRGLLSTGIAATTGGLLGAKVGSELAQTGLFINRVKKGYKKANVPFKASFPERVMMHKVMQEGVKEIKEGVFNTARDKRSQQLYTKLLNKASRIGGIKGAAIGAGLTGGTALLINKIRNRKEK